MKKILFAFGTRPEAIKMIPVIREAHAQGDLDVKVLVTHQHREMLDQVLEVFQVRPDFDLSVMEPGQSLEGLTSKILNGMAEVFKAYRPDAVLVHGDTTTTFAVALASFYQQIPVAHVEAGLRTNQRYSPFPEELNRQLTSKLASLHFAPTQVSKENLLAEGIPEDAICVTGNTVIDALFMACERLDRSPTREPRNACDGRSYVLITGHRRENFGTNFENICNAIQELAHRYPNLDFIFPVHLNPKVQAPVNAILGQVANVKLLPPAGYLEFVALMRKALLILTDSGGVQEEAPSLGVPVLVMRDNTERPEAVEAGTVKLVGASRERIVSQVSALLDDTSAYEEMKRATNPYGDGKAAERVLTRLREFL